MMRWKSKLQGSDSGQGVKSMMSLQVEVRIHQKTVESEIEHSKQ